MAKSINFGRLDSESSQRSEGNEAAVVFVHGFTGDWKKTWGRIPEFLMADPRLKGWDLFGFGFESRRRFDLLGLWSADAALPEIAIKLYTTISTEMPTGKYRAIAMVAVRASRREPSLVASAASQSMLSVARTPVSQWSVSPPEGRMVRVSPQSLHTR